MRANTFGLLALMMVISVALMLSAPAAAPGHSPRDVSIVRPEPAALPKGTRLRHEVQTPTNERGLEGDYYFLPHEKPEWRVPENWC